MASIALFAALMLITYAANALLLTAAAGRLGGTRVNVGRAAAVVVSLGVFGLVFDSATLAAHGGPGVRVTAFVFILAVLLVVWTAVFRRGFGLTRGRAWALTGVQFAWSLAVWALMLLVVRPLLLEGFVIPTGSMTPTLEPGDCFVVNKLLAPRRWDVVAYVTTREPGRVVYCKRLVGLPGERLRFDGGDLFVNDAAVPMPPVLAGRTHAAFSFVRRYHDGETIVLKPDEYFFVGDNVEQSADSRVEGPTVAKDLVGVGDWLYWPPSRIKLLR